jgi:hypothetical protein
MSQLSEPSPWMVVLAPTLLSLFAFGLYAVHRAFVDLQTRITALETKVDGLLAAWWKFINGTGTSP